MHHLTSVEDILDLIENQIPEGIHLDYKASDALSTKKKSEIAKDVSAFANSDGGQIIYGVIEDTEKHIPVKIDEGVNFEKQSPEWLENVLLGNIFPRIDGLHITPIKAPTGAVYYSIEIPKSFSGPHKALDRYFKRFNFQSVPMEFYEIEDVRNRQSILKPVINVSLFNKGMMFYWKLSNDSQYLVRDVKISFPDDLKWYSPDRAIKEKEIRFFQPKTELSFFFNTGPQLLQKEKSCLEFSVRASYLHPILEKKIEEVFPFDLSIYEGAMAEKTEIEEVANNITKIGKEIVKELNGIKKSTEEISLIANPTGLGLSFSTLKNLFALFSGKEFCPEEFFIKYRNNYESIMEILGVDTDLAIKIRESFSNRQKADEILKEVPEEIKAKINIFGKNKPR